MSQRANITAEIKKLQLEKRLAPTDTAGLTLLELRKFHADLLSTNPQQQQLSLQIPQLHQQVVPPQVINQVQPVLQPEKPNTNLQPIEEEYDSTQEEEEEKPPPTRVRRSRKNKDDNTTHEEVKVKDNTTHEVKKEVKEVKEIKEVKEEVKEELQNNKCHSMDPTELKEILDEYDSAIAHLLTLFERDKMTEDDVEELVEEYEELLDILNEDTEEITNRKQLTQIDRVTSRNRHKVSRFTRVSK